MVFKNSRKNFNRCNKLCFFHAVFLFLFLVSPLCGCSRSDFSISEPSAKNVRGECVLLLHGLGRSRRSMDEMQEALTEAGYHTVNFDYPSTRKNIESIAAEDIPLALDQCSQFNPGAINVVAHSMGGIVARQAFKVNRPQKLGRVVMLSPPNQGSMVVDTLKDRWFYKWLNGPAGQQLSTAAESVPNTLGGVDYPVGIITGDRYALFDAWFSSIIPGKDDGKVSVERAKVIGMDDFLVVHRSHSFIMNADYVKTETIHFLTHGKFRHRNDSSSSVSGTDWFTYTSR